MSTTTATRTAVTVIFRTELETGETVALFSGEPATRSREQDAMAYSRNEEHFMVTRGWYERRTRPATVAESQPVWDALLGRGYDVTQATRMAWA